MRGLKGVPKPTNPGANGQKRFLDSLVWSFGVAYFLVHFQAASCFFCVVYGILVIFMEGCQSTIAEEYVCFCLIAQFFGFFFWCIISNSSFVKDFSSKCGCLLRSSQMKSNNLHVCVKQQRDGDHCLFVWLPMFELVSCKPFLFEQMFPVMWVIIVCFRCIFDGLAIRSKAQILVGRCPLCHSSSPGQLPLRLQNGLQAGGWSFEGFVQQEAGFVPGGDSHIHIMP